MLIAGSSMREINNLKTRLSATFEMKDLGPAKQILGIKISRDRSAGTLNLSQELYIEKVLSRFRVNDAKSRTTPLANHFKLSKEQSPKTAEERDHITLVPYALAVGSLISSSTSLCFGKGKVTLQGFMDADIGGDVHSSKSTSGYIYTIGGTTVSWMSRLQKCVYLSSTEAEYIAIAEAGKKMIWLWSDKCPQTSKHSFSVGKYNKILVCDVVPILACPLLARTWQFDRDDVHQGRSKKYTFVIEGKKYVVAPLTVYEVSKDYRAMEDLGERINTKEEKGEGENSTSFQKEGSALAKNKNMCMIEKPNKCSKGVD
uniref:Reverse transcriptase Ty1/copia-type domain-containing protein n=1 Tax=Solanum lycopersicum TaxID=4081 RepID=A0A3Q7FKW4_SOLLC